MGVISLGSSLISLPHIDKECFVSFVFQSVVLTLKLIGIGPPHGECKVCKVPMPLMQSHSDNMGLLRRKLILKFKGKQKTAH